MASVLPLCADTLVERGTIMNITDGLLQAGGSDWVRKTSASVPDSKNGATAKSRSSDSVSISGDARRMSSTATVRARVDALPESREERIQDVKARVENGYYNTEEFHGQLADKLLLTQFGA